MIFDIIFDKMQLPVAELQIELLPSVKFIKWHCILAYAKLKSIYCMSLSTIQEHPCVNNIGVQN